MGQDEHCPALRRCDEIDRERASRRLVEVLRRLVENQDPHVGKERPRKCEPLALAAREPRAVLPHRGGEAVGKGRGPVEELGIRKGLAQLVVGGARAGKPQVVGDRGVEHVGILFAEPDGPPDVVPG